MNLKPGQTLAILLVFLLVGGAATWFCHLGFTPSGPGDLGVDSRGRLYAHFQDRVFRFDPQGSPLAVYDLGEVGAESLIGGLSFFPDGDWLIAPDGGRSGGELQRCTAGDKLYCAPLPGFHRRFARTFRTAVDARSRFYLSDSARHRLSLHAPDGTEIAASGARLRYPGEVKLYGDKLAVADVDNLRMQIFGIDPESGRWTGVVQEFATRSPQLAERMINQPVDFFLYHDMWYVLVKDVTMAFARLHRYSLDGEYIDQLPLPDNGLIMAMERLGDTVVLSDFRHKRLLRMGLDGAPLPDVGGEAWRLHAQQLASAGRLNLWIGLGFWGLFATLLGAGFVIGMRQRDTAAAGVAAEPPAAASPRADTPPPSSLQDPAIVWLRRSSGFGLIVSLTGAALAAFLGYGFWLELQGDCLHHALGGTVLLASGLMLLILAPAAWLWYKLGHTRVGRYGDWVLVELPDRQVVRARARDVRHVRGVQLLVGSRKLLLGPPNNRYYHKADFQQYLQPLLGPEAAMSRADLWRWRRAHDGPGLLLEGGALLLALALGAWWVTGGKVDLEQRMKADIQACKRDDAVRGTEAPGAVPVR